MLTLDNDGGITHINQPSKSSQQNGPGVRTSNIQHVVLTHCERIATERGKERGR